MAKPLSKKIGAFAVNDLGYAYFQAQCCYLYQLFLMAIPNSIIFYLQTFKGWITVIYLGFIMQPIAYGTWYHVMGRYPVHKVMPVMLIASSYRIVNRYFFAWRRALQNKYLLGGAIIVIWNWYDII